MIKQRSTQTERTIRALISNMHSSELDAHHAAPTIRQSVLYCAATADKLYYRHVKQKYR